MITEKQNMTSFFYEKGKIDYLILSFGGALAPPKICQVAKVFFCCYPSILTGKTPNFMLIIFYTMRNVVFLVIKATP